MHVQRLDHVNIRTHDLDATRDFYVGVLGLRDGDRPPFNFPGLWLYDENVAVIHVTGLTSHDPPDRPGGAVDHIAFRVAGLAAMRERIHAARLPVREAIVPSSGDVQLFLADPNGVQIELNFAGIEAASARDVLVQH